MQEGGLASDMMVGVEGSIGHDWCYDVRGYFNSSQAEGGSFTYNDPLDGEADQRDLNYGVFDASDGWGSWLESGVSCADLIDMEVIALYLQGVHTTRLKEFVDLSEHMLNVDLCGHVIDKALVGTTGFHPFTRLEEDTRWRGVVPADTWNLVWATVNTGRACGSDGLRVEALLCLDAENRWCLQRFIEHHLFGDAWPQCWRTLFGIVLKNSTHQSC